MESDLFFPITKLYIYSMLYKVAFKCSVQTILPACKRMLRWKISLRGYLSLSLSLSLSVCLSVCLSIHPSIHLIYLSFIKYHSELTILGVLISYCCIKNYPQIEWFKIRALGFSGGAVVKNLPANEGDMGSSPGTGRFHMPRSSWACGPHYWACALEPTSHNYWSPRA